MRHQSFNSPGMFLILWLFPLRILPWDIWVFLLDFEAVRAFIFDQTGRTPQVGIKAPDLQAGPWQAVATTAKAQHRLNR